MELTPRRSGRARFVVRRKTRPLPASVITLSCGAAGILHRRSSSNSGSGSRRPRSLATGGSSGAFIIAVSNSDGTVSAGSRSASGGGLRLRGRAGATTCLRQGFRFRSVDGSRGGFNGWCASRSRRHVVDGRRGKAEEKRGPAGGNAGSAGDRFRGVAYNWRLATFLLRGRTGVVGGGCCWLGGDKSVVFRVGLLTATTTTQRARCC